MIVIDANLLLYAYDTSSLHHVRAREWLERVFSSGEPIGLPWHSIAAFLRVVTNPRLPGERFSPGDAAQVVDSWVQHPGIHVLAPGEHHWPLFRRMMLEGQARGPLLSDAQVAALTIEFGGVLHTTDRDFGRFPGLRWTNPLE